MKIPRVSVQTIMAAVVVVAADCMACRAVATRPEEMAGWLDSVLLNSLPMVNILAIGSALWIRGRRAIGSFWPGFVAIGLVSVMASSVWLEPILDAYDEAATGSSLEAWVGTSPHRELVVQYGLGPILLLAPQLIVASIAGGLTRLLGRRSASRAEVPGPRRQVAALVAMVALVATPALGVEVYLRVAVDRKIARLAANSEAVVVTPHLLLVLSTPFATIPPLTCLKESRVSEGTRVRVDRDEDRSRISSVAIGLNGETVVGDFRVVRVTVLEGEQAGKSGMIPRCGLRPNGILRNDRPGPAGTP